MLRYISAYLLTALLALTGFTLADARGQDPVVGATLVICSGTTITTITIGPDGQPVEKNAPCPDGTALFAATFTLPELTPPATPLLAVLVPSLPRALSARNQLWPSARDPPVVI